MEGDGNKSTHLEMSPKVRMSLIPDPNRPRAAIRAPKYPSAARSDGHAEYKGIARSAFRMNHVDFAHDITSCEPSGIAMGPYETVKNLGLTLEKRGGVRYTKNVGFLVPHATLVKGQTPMIYVIRLRLPSEAGYLFLRLSPGYLLVKSYFTIGRLCKNRGSITRYSRMNQADASLIRLAPERITSHFQFFINLIRCHPINTDTLIMFKNFNYGIEELFSRSPYPHDVDGIRGWQQLLAHCLRFSNGRCYEAGKSFCYTVIFVCLLTKIFGLSLQFTYCNLDSLNFTFHYHPLLFFNLSLTI